MAFDGRWWITYNGEIYNFRELRAGLEQRGERFASDCDTEVLLRLFVLDGPAMLEQLNGIFAFAIWDDRDRKLFLARDRLGVKPLYWTQRDGIVRLRLRAARAPAADRPADARRDGDRRLPHVPLGARPEDGVQRDPQAAAGPLRVGRRDVVHGPPVLGPAVRAGGACPRASGAIGLPTRSRRSVRRQMVSDVPLGAFLSGGVDSSAIVAAMSEGGKQRVSTYTVGFAEEDLRHEIVPDDLVHARRVAALFDTDYFEQILEPNALELLPKAVWHLEEPVADPAAISTYLICREASARMPVMLSGMGGRRDLRRLPALPRLRHLALARPHPAADHRTVSSGCVSGAARPGRPGQAARAAPQPLEVHARRRAAAQRALPRLLHATTRRPSSARSSRRTSPSASATTIRSRGHRALFERVAGEDELSRLLYLDAKTFLPCLNLDLHRQDGDGRLGRGARAAARRRARRAGRAHPVEPEAERAEAEVHLQEEPGVGAAARHRLAQEGRLRRADPLVARARTSRRSCATRSPRGRSRGAGSSTRRRWPD